MTVDVFAADEQGDHPVDTLRWARLAEAVLGKRGSRVMPNFRCCSSTRALLPNSTAGSSGRTGRQTSWPSRSTRSPSKAGARPIPADGPGMPSEPEDMPVLLGDIVICPAVAYRNAPEHAGNYDDEVALLVVHGLLHLMGMDHQEDEEAEEMEAKERGAAWRVTTPRSRPEAWKAKPAGDGPAGQTGADHMRDRPDGGTGTRRTTTRAGLRRARTEPPGDG